MTAIDATGLKAIQDFADALHQSGRTLLVCGALPQPAYLMSQAGRREHPGERHSSPGARRNRVAGVYKS